MLQIGSTAPDFRLQGTAGTTVSLSQRASPYAVIVFYPKNNTPG